MVRRAESTRSPAFGAVLRASSAVMGSSDRKQNDAFCTRCSRIGARSVYPKRVGRPSGGTLRPILFFRETEECDYVESFEDFSGLRGRNRLPGRNGGRAV